MTMAFSFTLSHPLIDTLSIITSILVCLHEKQILTFSQYLSIIKLSLICVSKQEDECSQAMKQAFKSLKSGAGSN